MKLYVYDKETLEVVAIAEGNQYEECESKAENFFDQYAATYSPAFGAADGLIENINVEIL